MRLNRRQRERSFLGWGLVALATVLPARAGDMVRSGTLRSMPPCVRIVEDRALGLRWRMEPQSGARPSRLVQVQERSGALPERPCKAASAANFETERKADAIPGASRAIPSRAIQSGAIREKPVIQVGDRVVVVQAGSSVVARLPGVALAAAAIGQPLPVRLRIGNGGFGKLAGQVVETLAVTQGVARWDGEAQQNGAGW